MIRNTGSRAWCRAVGGPLERRVRRSPNVEAALPALHTALEAEPARAARRAVAGGGARTQWLRSAAVWRVVLAGTPLKPPGPRYRCLHVCATAGSLSWLWVVCHGLHFGCFLGTLNRTAPNAELTGRRRVDARPARCMMNQGAARAWWPAVGAPVERQVRHQSATALRFFPRTRALSRRATYSNQFWSVR